MNIKVVLGEAQPDDAFDLVCPINDLQNKVEPASATNISCDTILDYCSNKDAALQLLLSRLRYGGRISLKGLDIDEVARALVTRQIDIEQASSMLYSQKASCDSLNNMLGKLKSWPNIKVLNARLENFQYFITVERSARPTN